MDDYDREPISWEETERLVGREIAHHVGADPVNRPMVRHVLEALEWDCPIYRDDLAAENAGWPGVVAPWSTYITFGMPAYWQPGGPPIRHPTMAPLPYTKLPAPGSAMIATSCEVEFHSPMRPGDVISSRWTLTDVVRKHLSLGDGAFMTFEAKYHKQDGSLVAIDRTTVFRYEPGSDVG